MNKRYFDSRRDAEVIAAGGFFCQTCLVGKPATERSPDLRYCQGCYEFLKEETERISFRTNCLEPVEGKDIAQKPPEKALEAVERGDIINLGVSKGGGIMSTLESKKDDGKRGRKKLTLPVETILEMSKQGLGSKAIATLLRTKQGVDVSYKTIQRTLADEREFNKHEERSNGEQKG